MKKMTICQYSTIYNINRSPLKDNSNMKENEYEKHKNHNMKKVTNR